jgi:hypothetical protein
MSTNSNLAQLKIEKPKSVILPKEASQILEILNELENFTLSMRLKLTKEMSSSNNLSR